MEKLLLRDGGAPETPLSLDDILEVLSNYQRRAIIKHLRDSPGDLHSLDEVVDHLKKVERERHGESPGEDHLLVVLVHIHGPKLRELGLVDYDVSTTEVHYHPNERVERILEQLETAVEDFEQG